MQINGYRTLTDALNGTHEAALLGACNKMFWSEAHQRTDRARPGHPGHARPDPRGLRAAPRGSCRGTAGAGRTTRSRTCRRAFFFSRSETIWGGTAEIQRNIVGERALGLPKEPKVPSA